MVRVVLLVVGNGIVGKFVKNAVAVSTVVETTTTAVREMAVAPDAMMETRVEHWLDHTRHGDALN